MQPYESLGNRIRELRRRKGIGIKGAAPALGVSYTYLSKLENERASPSDVVLKRMAQYYDVDPDELFVLAERIPDDVRRILRENPREALDFLRSRFGGTGADSRQ